jgi:hypothetical protein
VLLLRRFPGVNLGNQQQFGQDIRYPNRDSIRATPEHKHKISSFGRLAEGASRQKLNVREFRTSEQNINFCMAYFGFC